MVISQLFHNYFTITKLLFFFFLTNIKNINPSKKSIIIKTNINFQNLPSTNF
jgi:hypothetical protein